MNYSTALLIDDDPLAHVVGEEVLRALGVEKVVSAADGDTGLSVLSQGPGTFDLLLCDLNMPDLDGVGVIRELGRLGFDGGLVIVSGEDTDVIRTVRAMADLVGVRVLGAIKKPLTVDELGGILKREVAPSQNKNLITRRSLKLAFDERRIVPFYQPKIDLRTGECAGLEVLARHAGTDGTISKPSRVLEAAAREDLMVELTMVIFEQVLSHARIWQDKSFIPPLALNFNPLILSELDLPDWVISRIKRARLDPRDFTIEITEDKLMTYEANVLEVLSRFRLGGLRLSLDDFGTGATSIEQMRLFPFNELKIDQSFVQGATNDGFARTTVETSARLARMLGLSVVAEGVETLAQLRFVKAVGARQVQGFLFAKPMPANAVLDWANRFKAPKEDVA